MIINPFMFVPYIGPLDVYSTSIWGAWSVARRMKASWTGAILRVRETGGSTELDIGTRADGTVDEAAIVAHCGANAGKVVTVYDQSGNGKNLTQATASRQMEIYTGSVIRKNSDGKVAMYNDATGQKHLKSTLDTGLVQPATVFLYAEDVSPWVNGNCRFDGAPAAGFGNLSQQPAPGGGNAKCYAGLHIVGAAGHFTENNPFILTCLFNGASSLARMDNNADQTGNAGTNSFHGFTWGAFASGPGNSPANCYHTDAMVYSAGLSAGNRDLVITNFNERWATY